MWGLVGRADRLFAGALIALGCLLGGCAPESAPGDGLAFADLEAGSLPISDLLAPLAAAQPEASGETRPRIPAETVSTDPDPTKPPLLMTRRTLGLLEAHYLLPDRLEPAALFRGAVQRLAAVTGDGLFLEGQDGGLDTLMIGRRAVLLDGHALADSDALVDALASVASFYRQSTVFHDLATEEDVENTLIAGMMATLDNPTRLLIDRGLESFQVRSRGSLIGVGLVLRVLDGRPQVIEVVDDGPCARAGVKRGDRIVRVDGESTLDMPIRDVVSRLRGEVDTTVSFEVERRGTPAPLTFNVARENVTVANVRAARLDGDIGYLEITNFSDLTLSNFQTKMAEMTASGVPLKGFVLDLRANRGGSLRQSAFLADQFLTSGLLVRTVGRNDERVRGLVERIDATSEVAIAPSVPVAVLVSPKTASGAEILAGSLKYHDRAIILGQGTFGKGTVQKVYKLAPGASLKATVARYLLEGDHWIHKVGIEPDIELRTIVVDDQKVRFNDTSDLAEQAEDEETWEDGFHGEREARALYSLAYVQDRVTVAVEADGEDGGEQAEDEAPTPVPTQEERIKGDFEVAFAARLLKEAGQATRGGTLAGAPAVIAAAGAAEEAKLVRALSARHVDWSPAPEGAVAARPSLDLSLKVGEGPEGLVTPSVDDVPLTLTARLAGEGSLHRVRIVTLCNDGMLSGHDFMVGRLDAGAPAQITLPIRLPPSVEPGMRELTLLVTADGLSEPVEVVRHLTIAAVERPQLSARVRYRDDGKGGSVGDGDYVPEAGETLALTVEVTNRGAVASGEVTISLRNPLRKDVEVLESRLRVDSIAPGQTVTAPLSIAIKAVPDVTELPPVEVPLVVVDRTYGFRLDETLHLAGDESLPKGGEPVVAASHPAPKWASRGLKLEAPDIEIRSVIPPGLVEGGSVELAVAASDDDGIRVLTLYKDRVKVGRLVGGAGSQSMDMRQAIPLEPGSHLIEVVAEDEAGLTSRQQLWATAAVPSGQVDADGR